MKTLNKLFVALILGFGLVAVRQASAANYAIAPKDTYCVSFTNAISTVAIGPGALYEVTLSTGASGEYVVPIDTATTVGSTLLSMHNNANPGALTGPLFYGSTTANTQIRFDPPIHFFSGLISADSTGAGSACYTYEVGRGLSGN